MYASLKRRADSQVGLQHCVIYPYGGLISVLVIDFHFTVLMIKEDQQSRGEACSRKKA